MNTHQCIICENTFLSNHTSSVKLNPWDCPNCNKDSYEKIQKDLNFLYELVGFDEAIDRICQRANRRLKLSHMYWKKDETPASIDMF